MIDKSSLIPIYHQIKEYFKHKILNGDIKADEKLMTENEIAKLYDVSRQPIVRAFKELETEGYIYRLQGKGSYCSPKAIKKYKNVGVIINGHEDYITSKIISGITKELSKRDYSSIIKNVEYSSYDEKRNIADMINNKVSGLIISPQYSQVRIGIESDIFTDILAKDIPFLLIDSGDEKGELPFVLPDDVKGGYLAAKHLLELGHKNIMFFSPVKGKACRDRKHGFEKALQEYNVELSEKYYITDIIEDDEGISEDDFWGVSNENTSISSDKHDITDNAYFKLIRKKLHDYPEITAAFCFNDLYATLLIDTLEALGKKVPDDFSVVGFDNSLLSVTRDVRLTTIDRPQFEYGVRAVEVIIDMIEGKKDCNYKEFMDVELINRDSTKLISS